VSRRAMLVAATWATMVILAGSAHAQSSTVPGERFVLSGLVFAESGRGVAWLQEPVFTGNRVVTVRVGDSVGPYRVTKILENQVELQGPGGTVSVPLAGAPGAVSVAASRETLKRPAEERSPQPAVKNPEPIVIPRGDPRRDFPASTLLIGAGARVGEVRKQASQAPSSEQPAVSSVPLVPPAAARPIPASMQTPPPDLPPHPALSNPQAIVIPRGDPRRNFPASTLLIGAGALAGGGR
jgi:hypothetical protein